MRPRIRTIKPEIFKDEELWDLAQTTGLPILQAFEGLWCFADKEGRFEWRPRALKTDILPYWDGDFSRVLDALTTRGFIVKYACGTREYGLVRTFKRHQVINNREADSELPPPPDETTPPKGENGYKPKIPDTPTREARVDDASGTRPVHAQAEREGNGKGTEGNGSGKGASPTREARAPDERFPALKTQIRQMFALQFEIAEGSLWTQANDPALDTFAAWALSLADPFAAAQQAIANFFADPWVKSKHYPIAHLAKYPQKYHSPRELEAEAPETVESLRKVGMAALLRGDQAEVAKIGKRITALENKADSQVRRAR